MTRFNTVVTASLSVLIFLFQANLNASTPKQISWDDLLPEGWNPARVFEEMSDEEFNAIPDDEYQKILLRIQAEMDAAPVIEALDGELVKIPGFIVPLEITNTSISEFLLVPYFGACTHTPPPPANQIIYSKIKNEYTTNDLTEPVWITGKLITGRFISQLNEAGVSQAADISSSYSLEVEKIEKYKEGQHSY